MSILAAERQQQILQRLDREGRVLAAPLAEAFAIPDHLLTAPIAFDCESSRVFGSVITRLDCRD